MQVSNISSIGFYSKAPKRIVNNVANRIEKSAQDNPMTKFVKETKDYHEYISSGKNYGAEQIQVNRIDYYPSRQIVERTQEPDIAQNIRQIELF